MRKLILLLPLLIFGCTANRVISYKTDDITAPASAKPIPITVDIMVFDDNRPNDPSNSMLFSNPRETKINGKRYCINAEKHYKDTVTAQIGKLMADHFNKSRLFMLSSYNKTSYNKYYLTGSLNKFYGEQEYSNAAAVGAQFGLIGALATSGITSPGTIIIEMSDLKLYKKDGTLVKELGNFYKEYSDDFKADAACWNIYFITNEKLKDFISHLSEKIREGLKDVEFD